MNILLTGGAGYIGSHTAVALKYNGHKVVLLDNFSNSEKSVLSKLQQITGSPLECVEGDVRDTKLLIKTIANFGVDVVIHFAGLKSVAESVKFPLQYFDNNVQGAISLLQAMQETQIKTLVFSSSATVYGEPQYLPISEVHPTSATNPYGRSKLMVEDILADLHQADNRWRIARLRYFNPVGAHESGLIGEAPHGIPNNLMPFLAQVAAGQRELLNVWGNDYPTHDGTGVRDYIHVCDLAEAHVSALEYLAREGGLLTLNLGTGQAFSVLDMVNAFAKVSGCYVPYKIGPRRAGDSAICWADPALAKRLIGWEAKRDIDRMCLDAWRWQLHSLQ